MAYIEPFLEIIPEMSNSALVKTKYSVDNVSVQWHRHAEIELVYIVEGCGILVVGDTNLSYKAGNLLIFGSNVPHMFCTEDKTNGRNTHIVVQFSSKLLSPDLIMLTEFANIRHLSKSFEFGLMLENALPIVSQLEKLLEASMFDSILQLYKILNELSENKEIHRISVLPCGKDTKDNSRIGKVYQFVLNHYEENISVAEVAEMLNVSKPAFCNFFKKKVNKHFTEFVNEVRINKACLLLRETEYSASEICYMTGFTNLSYFNRYFNKLKKCSPAKYRQQYNFNNREE